MRNFRRDRSKPQRDHERVEGVKITRARMWVALCVLGVAAAAAFVSSNTASARESALPNEIKIGVLATLTGPIGYAGLEAKKGLDVAVAEINAKGGIAGKRVRLIYKDDALNPTRTVQNTQELLSRDGAHIILGATTSNTTLAASAILNQAEVLHLLTNAASDGLIDPVKFPYSFRGFTINSKCYGGGISDWVRRKGFSTVAILGRSDEFGRSITAAVKRFLALRAPNTKIVAEETMAPNAPDVTPQLLSIQKERPKAIIGTIFHNDGVALLKSAQKIGYLDNLPPTIVAEAWAAEYWDAGVPVTKTLTVMLNNWLRPLPPKALAFHKKMAARYGTKGPGANTSSAQAYDDIYLIKQAVEATKSVDGKVLKAYLERGLKSLYRGVNATVAFSPASHDPIQSGFCSVAKVGPKFESGIFNRAIPLKKR